jgi:hypothetical protein
MVPAEAVTGRHRKADALALADGEDRSDFQAGDRPWVPGNVFGFTKFTESDNWKSATARANWARMARELPVRGAYHFFHPAISAVAQANFFVGYVRACGGWRPGDVFAGDVEISIGEDGMETAAEHVLPRMAVPLQRVPMGRSLEAVGSSALTFLDTVAKLVGPANPVVLYTYLSFRSGLTECVRYPLWAADYAASPPSSVAPWPRWTIWQNADHGGVGGGDTNRFNGDEAELLAWIASFVPKPADWTEAMVAELPTLKLGDKDAPGANQAVGKMQALLAFVGAKNGLPAAAGLPQDGNFGTRTRQAVEAAQAFYHITGGNGECGQHTWTRLLLG